MMTREARRGCQRNTGSDGQDRKKRRESTKKKDALNFLVHVFDEECE